MEVWHVIGVIHSIFSSVLPPDLSPSFLQFCINLNSSKTSNIYDDLFKGACEGLMYITKKIFQPRKTVLFFSKKKKLKSDTKIENHPINNK